MFKTFITHVLIFAFLSSTTSASTGASFKKSVQELTYSLTVEWDQEDENFFKDRLSRFSEEVKILKAEGLESEEAMNILGKEFMVSPNILVKLEPNLFEDLSVEEIMEVLKSSSSRGASWNGLIVDFGLYAVLCTMILVFVFKPIDDSRH